MRTYLSIGALCIALALPAAGNSTEEAVRKDLAGALSKLSAQREQQAKEKPELGRSVAKLERELITLRRQQRLARLGADGRKEELSMLTQSVYGFEKDAHYMRGLYRDFAIQLGSQLQPGQKALYAEKLELSVNKTRSLTQQSEVLDAAMDRLESIIGGEKIAAEVVGEDGRVLSGEVVNQGLASWFVDSSSEVAGVVVLEKGATHARLIKENPTTVKQLLRDGKAELKIDFTGGKARSIEQIEHSSSKLFTKGGVWLIPILGIALISAICGVIKLLQLLKIKEPAGGWMADILSAVRENNLEEAERISERAQHPVGDLIKNALAYTSAGADVVEEVIYEQLIGVQSQLQKWLPFIAVTAATAPLLGLLGTVSGMIRMFNVITVTGTGDVKPMAGGISEALITTLFGLIVAIPALIIHTMLSRRSHGVVQTTEKLGLTFVNGLRKLK